MPGVFLLWHHRADGPKDDDAKLLGVFSTREMAQQRIESKYEMLPGFSNSNTGEFTIDCYEVDRDHWQEGFGPVEME